MKPAVSRSVGRWERRRSVTAWGLALLLAVLAVVGWQVRDHVPGQADRGPDTVSGEARQGDATGVDAGGGGTAGQILGSGQPGPIVSAVPVGEPQTPSPDEVADLEELESTDGPVSPDEEAELEELVTSPAEGADDAPAQTQEELEAAVAEFLEERPDEPADVEELEDAQEPVLDDSVGADLDAEAAEQDAELAEQLADLPVSQP